MRALRRHLRPEQIRELVLLLLIVLVIVFFGTQIPNYYSARFFNRVSTSVAIIAVVAVGQTLVFLTRNYDLSVGSIVGFTAYFVGQQLSHNNDIAPLAAVLMAIAVGALMGAYRARIPFLFRAGRTPITEEGSPASRSRPIHWAQDAFDQAGMLREYVKWDYELRTPSQLESVVDRAMAMAMSEPKGPIYLTLPREILATPLEEVEFQAQPRYDLPTYHPDPVKVQEAARILCEAKYPLIITSSAGRSQAAVQALMDLADTEAIGVVSFNPEYMNFPTDHPCHQGFFPDPYLSEADVLVVVDCDVPWFTNIKKPRDSAFIIQAGIDPFYSDYPIRGFPSDLTLQGDPALIFSGLKRAISDLSDGNEGAMAARRKRFQKTHDAVVRGWQASAQEAASDRPIDPRWVSQSVNRILGDDGILVNEIGLITQVGEVKKIIGLV